VRTFPFLTNHGCQMGNSLVVTLQVLTCFIILISIVLRIYMIKVGTNSWLDRFLVRKLQIKYFTRHLFLRLRKIELFGKRKDTVVTLYVVLIGRV